MTAPAESPEEGALHSPEGAAGEASAPSGFAVALSNFNGPFDLLLHLIASKEMDVTRVALAEVTDEFLAYTFRLADDPADERSEDERLEERTGFLVVAATLLDLKAARLLPGGEVESVEDVEALEARDLLFAKLLQYKAFKHAAEHIGERMAAHATAFPREVPRGFGFEGLQPPLELSVTPDELARIAEAALSQAKPPRPTEVGLTHLHGSLVTVAGESEEIAGRLAAAGRLSFAELTADAESRLVLVVRFLALLELYRRSLIVLEQEDEEIAVEWTGPSDAEEALEGAVIEDYEGTAPEGAGA
ncbi:segregation and condensation protein A [Arthrobacter sp. UM1]|uniref:segregation and condensation protein A n=1 Tax=Arthrobacter sp. UM1 TaxID=2766776 RepID=UPI001CF6C442|nr:ScpA family protein [Arthrobacter sp. UM1]